MEADLPQEEEDEEDGMDATTTYVDAAERGKWSATDRRRVRDEGSWTPYRVAKNGQDRCFVRRDKGDPVWWIKVVGQVTHDRPDERDLLANVDNLLDAALLQRQHEWHQLFRGGRIVERVDEAAEVCYFQYASPVLFVSGRDTCYCKVRHDLPDGGFILSYRSVAHADCPPHKAFVRLAFEGAHMITPLPDGRPGFTYTYIQHADAKGRLPKWMANGPQADVMLKEIEGVRKAVREGSIVDVSSESKTK